MKNLNDCIIESLESNSTREIMSFLDENGFKQLRAKGETIIDFIRILNKEHDKCFVEEEDGLRFMVLFADTSDGPISKYNPAYCYREGGYCSKCTGDGFKDIQELSFKEFEKEIERYVER